MVQSYYDPNLFKTDAPCPIIYDIFKKYKKENNEKEYFKNVKEDSYKYKILEKEIKINPLFIESTEELNTKYPQNPFPNWGPKAKAKEKKKEI
jgi:tRNA (guanine26-N2/guanine27-N2)-dimethyltransferase